jgi:hypothetical protein
LFLKASAFQEKELTLSCTINDQAYLFVVEFLRVLFLFAFLSFENVEICGLSKSIQLIGYSIYFNGLAAK